MFQRSVLAAVTGLLACSGYAMAMDAPKLSLDPTVLTPDSTAPQGLLMQGLDKAGMGKTLADAKLNIYGWVESGYTYNHRNGSGNNDVIIPGPFNHEYGNHYMLNQFVLRFEREVAADPKNFAFGGMIELMYGSDAAKLHARGGFGFDGSDLSDDGNPNDPLSATPTAVVNRRPTWQFDIPQVYVDVNVPVGNGLVLRVGKFYALCGYEAVDPRGNAFYSHSYLFNAMPFTQSGILASYQVNDQLGLKLGVTRGWDIATEDNNNDAIDVIGQVSYKFSNQLSAVFNYHVGPENADDSGHYRVLLNPILYWQATDALKIGVEGLYVYDGGYNGNIAGFSAGRTHAYGDVWGAALYAGYLVNENLTINGRVEKAHADLGSYAGSTYLRSGAIQAVNVYEVTLGVTITPMPKDQFLKGLSIRPEVRYDFTDSTANKFFQAGGSTFKDQLTFACDVVFTF